MRARREVPAVAAERYRLAAGRAAKERIPDEVSTVTGWHRKQAMREHFA